MAHYNEHIKEFFQKVVCPQEAVKEFIRIEERLDNEPEFGKKMDEMVTGYMFPTASDLGKYLDIIENEIALEFNENVYTLHFVFLLNCTEELHNRYREKGISDGIYWDTMQDLKYKLIECIECEHVAGTFVAGWNGGFFEMNRFALGRFQFETSTYTSDVTFVTRCGHEIKKGDKVIGFHIPSSGVGLTDEVRLDSYKRAYQFYKDTLKEGEPLVLMCGSWLLYPKHKEFLPKHLNILRFMDDFEIISDGIDEEGFHNDWRIFGHWTELPLEQWPEDNSLRKAYKHWLLDGNKAGDGYGCIIFDGEKILR